MLCRSVLTAYSGLTCCHVSRSVSARAEVLLCSVHSGTVGCQVQGNPLLHFTATPPTQQSFGLMPSLKWEISPESKRAQICFPK